MSDEGRNYGKDAILGVCNIGCRGCHPWPKYRYTGYRYRCRPKDPCGPFSSYPYLPCRRPACSEEGGACRYKCGKVFACCTSPLGKCPICGSEMNTPCCGVYICQNGCRYYKESLCKPNCCSTFASCQNQSYRAFGSNSCNCSGLYQQNFKC